MVAPSLPYTDMAKKKKTRNLHLIQCWSDLRLSVKEYDPLLEHFKTTI